jgi:hypothetical protein
VDSVPSESWLDLTLFDAVKARDVVEGFLRQPVATTSAPRQLDGRTAVRWRCRLPREAEAVVQSLVAPTFTEAKS